MSCDCDNRIDMLQNVLGDCRVARETLRTERDEALRDLAQSSNTVNSLSKQRTELGIQITELNREITRLKDGWNNCATLLSEERDYHARVADRREDSNRIGP